MNIDPVPLRLVRLYEVVEPPWAALLAGRIADLYCAHPTVLPAHRSTLSRLTLALTQWWPSRQPALGDIYAGDYSQALNLLWGVPSSRREVHQIETPILKAVLIQMRVLSRIESQLCERRPGLGSDVHEVESDCLVDLFQGLAATFSPATIEPLVSWTEEVIRVPPPSWSEGMQAIYGETEVPTRPPGERGSPL